MRAPSFLAIAELPVEEIHEYVAPRYFTPLDNASTFLKRSLTFLQHRHFTISTTPFFLSATAPRISMGHSSRRDARESSTIGASRLRRRDADEARRHAAATLTTPTSMTTTLFEAALYEITSPPPTSRAIYACIHSLVEDGSWALLNFQPWSLKQNNVKSKMNDVPNFIQFYDSSIHLDLYY